MNKFLLAQSYQACLEHIKELIGSAVRDLIASLSSIRGETDHRRYEDLLETYSKRAQYEAVSEGEQFVETFFGNICATTLPDMCKLYPANERVVKMAVYYVNRHLVALKAPLCAYLKSYCAKKMGELRDLSIKHHLKQHGEATTQSSAPSGASSTVESRALNNQSTIDLDAKRARIVVQIHELAQALSQFIAVSGDSAAAAGLPELWLEESNKSCQVIFGSLARNLSDEQTPPQAVIVRNNIASLLGALLELTGQVSAYASTRFLVSEKHELKLSPSSSPAVPFDLKAALTNLTKLFLCCITALAETIETEFESFSETARSEIEGKIAADVAKFLTSMVPHLLYLDLAYASLCTPEVESATLALVVYSTKRPAESGTADASQVSQALLPLPSDLLHSVVACRLVTLDMLSRTLTLTARAKTAAFYENCKGLVGFTTCANHAMLCTIGRMLVRRQDLLGIDMSVLEDGGWYKDSTIRLLVKSNLSEPLSNLISLLLVSL